MSDSRIAFLFPLKSVDIILLSSNFQCCRWEIWLPVWFSFFLENNLCLVSVSLLHFSFILWAEHDYWARARCFYLHNHSWNSVNPFFLWFKSSAIQGNFLALFVQLLALLIDSCFWNMKFLLFVSWVRSPNILISFLPFSLFSYLYSKMTFSPI